MTVNQPKIRQKCLKDSSALSCQVIFSFSIIKTKQISMNFVRGVIWFFSTPELHLLKLSLNETAAEDLSRLGLFEVTQLHESRSVSQWPLHVNLPQYSTKNLTMRQLLPIQSCLFLFQIEDTSGIKLTNLLNSPVVTLNWSLLTDKLFKQGWLIPQKLRNI